MFPDPRNRTAAHATASAGCGIDLTVLVPIDTATAITTDGREQV